METCVGQILGLEAKQMVHAKRDIAACAGDDGTVKMYTAWLPEAACDKFMSCVDDYVTSHGP
jgi:hypothetical protein